MKNLNYLMIIGWLLLISCTKSTHVLCPDFKGKKNSNFVKMEFNFHQKNKKLNKRPFSIHLKKVPQEDQTEPFFIKLNLLGTSNKKLSLPNKNFNFSSIPLKLNSNSSLKIKAFTIVNKHDYQKLSFPNAQKKDSISRPKYGYKLFIPLLSVTFGILAGGFVVPVYTSGLLVGLIAAPIAAGICITLGFIGLRRKLKGEGLFFSIVGIVLGFLSLVALAPILLFFLAYI
ncbi:MAG: hypothetical protein KA251_11195 [Saprospiraceae bacterium]|nr:hypothetical protein [Candidatus Vicinibacter affinis]MBP6173720.1 hypothetical protein [Saprospiraceae bacterium]MBK6573780.1 hypothetical protein [Candidatus Vicinibacter affinis]MBK6821774.1 hypothetical protein [Candidatus Vicinibacter affinis]MBK7695682.1 hypothetical protein [Candidatus Vicinibacter affinis]